MAIQHLPAQRSNRRIYAGLAACLLALSLPAAARSAVLFQDDFSYSDQALTATPARKWTSVSTPPPIDLQVVGGAVVLDSTKAQDARTSIFSSSTGEVYASFDLKVESLPGDGDYFASFYETSSTTHIARIGIRRLSAEPGKFQVGLSSAGGGSLQYESTRRSPADLIRVVLAYRTEGTDKTVRLWVNPTAEADASWAILNNTSHVATSFALRQPSTTSYGKLRLDNLTIGERFGDVVVPVPEPTALVAAVGAGLLLLRRRVGSTVGR